MATASEKSISYHTNTGRTLVYELEDTSNYGITLSSVPSEIVTTETFLAEEHVLPCVETAIVVPATGSSSSLSSSTDNKLCHHLPMEIEERMRNCLHASAEIISSLSKEQIPNFHGYTTPHTNLYSVTPIEYKDDPESSSEDESDYTDQRGLKENIDEDFAILEDFATVLEESESVFEEVDDYTDDFDDFIISNDEVIEIIHEVEYSLEWPVVADVISKIEEQPESHQFPTENEELLSSPAAFSTSSCETVIERQLENLESVEDSKIEKDLEVEEPSTSSPRTVTSLIQFFETVAQKSKESSPSPPLCNFSKRDSFHSNNAIEITEDRPLKSPVSTIPAFISQTLLQQNQDQEQSVLSNSSVPVPVENEASNHFLLFSHSTTKIPSEMLQSHELSQIEGNSIPSIDDVDSLNLIPAPYDVESVTISSLELEENNVEVSSSTVSQMLPQGLPEHDSAFSESDRKNSENLSSLPETVTSSISDGTEKLDDADNVSTPNPLATEMLDEPLQEFTINHDIVEEEDFPIPNERFEQAAATSSDTELMNLINAYVEMVLKIPHQLISNIEEEALKEVVICSIPKHAVHMKENDKNTAKLTEDVSEQGEFCLFSAENGMGCDVLSKTVDELKTTCSSEEKDSDHVAKAVTSNFHEVSSVPLMQIPQEIGAEQEAQDQTVHMPETASAMTVEGNGNGSIVSECLTSESPDVIACFLEELIQIVAENNSDHHSTTRTEASMPVQDFPDPLSVVYKQEDVDLVEDNTENVNPADSAVNFTSSAQEDSEIENSSSSSYRNALSIPVNTVVAPPSNSNEEEEEEKQPVLVHSLDLTNELPSIPLRIIGQHESVNDFSSVLIGEVSHSNNIGEDQEQDDRTDVVNGNEIVLDSKVVDAQGGFTENINHQPEEEHDYSVDVSEASVPNDNIARLSSSTPPIDNQVVSDTDAKQKIDTKTLDSENLLDAQKDEAIDDDQKVFRSNFSIPSISVSETDSRNENDEERVEMMRQAVLRSKSIIEEKSNGEDREFHEETIPFEALKSDVSKDDSESCIVAVAGSTDEFKLEQHEIQMDSLILHKEENTDAGDVNDAVEHTEIDVLKPIGKANLETENGHLDNSSNSFKDADAESVITEVSNHTVVGNDTIELKQLAPDSTDDAVSTFTDMNSPDLDQSSIQCVETTDNISSSISDASEIDTSNEDEEENCESRDLSTLEDAPEVTDCDHIPTFENGCHGSETETHNDGNSVLDQEDNPKKELHESDRKCFNSGELNETGTGCDAGENDAVMNVAILTSPTMVTEPMSVIDNTEGEVKISETQKEANAETEQTFLTPTEHRFETSDSNVLNRTDHNSEESGDSYHQAEEELIEIKKAAADLVDSVLRRVITEMEQKNQDRSETHVVGVTNEQEQEEENDCVQHELSKCKSDVPQRENTHLDQEIVPEGNPLEVKDQMEPTAISGSEEVKNENDSDICAEQVIANGQLKKSDTVISAELGISTFVEKISDTKNSDINVLDSTSDRNEGSQEQSQQEEQALFEINRTAADLVDSVLATVVTEMEQRVKVPREANIDRITINREEEFMGLKHETVKTEKESVPGDSSFEEKDRTEPIPKNGELKATQNSETRALTSATLSSTGADLVDENETTPLVRTLAIFDNGDCLEADEKTGKLNSPSVTGSFLSATTQEGNVTSPVDIALKLKPSVIHLTLSESDTSLTTNESENPPQEENVKLAQGEVSRKSAEVDGDISLDISKDTMPIEENLQTEDEVTCENGKIICQEMESELHDKKENSTIDTPRFEQLSVSMNDEAIGLSDVLQTVSIAELNEPINQNQIVTDLPETNELGSKSLPAITKDNPYLENIVFSDSSDLIEIRLNVKLPDTNDNFVVAVVCPPDCREVLTAPIENDLDDQSATLKQDKIEHAVREIKESMDSLMSALEIGLPQITGSDESTATSVVRANFETPEFEQNTTSKSSVSLPNTTEINNKSDIATANTNCFMDSSSLNEHENVKCNVTRLHESQSGKQSESDFDRSTENVPTNDSLGLNPQTKDTSMAGKSLNISEQPKPSSVVEEVSYFLTTVAVAALSLGTLSENASDSGSSPNSDFNVDIIEDASKYIRSHPKPDNTE